MDSKTVLECVSDKGQCSQNVVAILGFWLKNNIHTTLPEHCLNGG